MQTNKSGAIASACFLALGGFVLLSLLLLETYRQGARLQQLLSPKQQPVIGDSLTNLEYALAARTADYIVNNELDASQFGEMGKRMKTVKEWINHVETANLSHHDQEMWSEMIENVVTTLVPFIRDPGNRDGRSLEQLRGRFVPGSKGLVITAGKKQFRYACHLIMNLRFVLKSELPVQIAYGGESDLPQSYRDFIVSIAPDVVTFDVTKIFDDQTLDLPNGGWAIKAFAILGSTFEQVMVLDADDVFLQPPETIFCDHPEYLKTGTLLFHDRLLWQGAFKERHAWWEKELENTTLSDTIKQSKVYMDGYAEEGDSGVVVADKARPGVLVGLVHIAWQNTKEVREKYTYRQGHGDKESWWFGFELTETPYSMESHYAAVAGHVKASENGLAEDRVCSFTIAHVDHKDRLLWFNGSLLKNKEVNSGEFDVPTEWMVDGTWEKGGTKQDMSCMSGASVQSLEQNVVQILRNSVRLARYVDEQLFARIPDTLL